MAYRSALARFAVAQVRVGRKVGNRRNSRDVMSGYAQYTKGFRVERLHRNQPVGKGWQEMLIEDKRATPAEIAACRIDFSDWLRLLTRRYRKIALTLAAGETTQATAKKFGLCSARISQIRQLLKESWERFQGEAKKADKRRRWRRRDVPQRRHGIGRGGRPPVILGIRTLYLGAKIWER